MSPQKKSKKNAEIFADTKKSATFAPAIEKQTMLKNDGGIAQLVRAHDS